MQAPGYDENRTDDLPEEDPKLAKRMGYKMPDMRKKKNIDLLSKIRGRYKAMFDADHEQRLEAMEDMKFTFVPGYQWDENMKQERGERPCYEFNKVRVSVKRVINEMRANRPSSKVRAVEGGDKKGADLRDGLIRNIFNRSEFDTVRDYAAEYQVGGGFAAWRVDTEYADDDVFEQDIWVRSIENPFCLYCDPSSKDFMKRDADDWILTERISDREYEARFPGAEKSDFDDSLEFDDEEDWQDENSTRIAEYWFKKPHTKELWQLIDGTVVDSESDEAGGIPEQAIKQRREVFTNKICRVLASGQRLLTEPEEWAGRKFPFVVIYGEYVVIDGEPRWYGLTRHAKDAQRSYNLARTSTIETIAQTPKGKWWATVTQAKGLEQQWTTAHKKNYPFMLYNADPEVSGPPKTEFGAQVPAGLAAEQQFASDDIKATTGIFDPSLGAQSNETSGRAIYARAQQGELATFNYADNMAKAVQYTAEILLDLIPEIYDTERELRILGSDGAEDYMTVNQVVMDYDSVPPRAVRVNDLAAGKYDVTVTTGPNFETQRQEATEMWSAITQNNPEVMSVAGDLIFKSMDLPYSEDIAERMVHLLPPQVQKQITEGKDVPPEIMQMMMQAEAAMAQVQEMAQGLQEVETQAKDAKGKAEVAEAQLREDIANLGKAKAEFDAHVANTLADITARENQIVTKAIAAESKLNKLKQDATDITFSERVEADQRIEIVDGLLAEFMTVVDQAVGNLSARAEQIATRANRRPIGGSTRREGGLMVADVQYDDGTTETVRARRQNGGLSIVPPEGDGTP